MALNDDDPLREEHGGKTGTPEIIEGLQAVCRMLSAVIRAAAPDTRAVILRWPSVETGTPSDFAARGALEMVLHANDICSGLGVGFEPPRVICARLRDQTEGWPGQQPITPSGDAWTDLLARSGRAD